MQAIHNNDWLAGSFPQVNGINEHDLCHHLDIPDNYISSEHINIQEMKVVLAAARRWGASWEGASIMIITDNATVQAAPSTGWSKCRNIMKLLQRLFWLSVQFNFVFTSLHIPSEVNLIADALSRLNESSSYSTILKGSYTVVIFIKKNISLQRPKTCM